MQQDKIIGIIGGMGPYAGLDLVRKIFDNTVAQTDQAHAPVALLSFPGCIPDRGDYLFERTSVNPGEAIGRIAVQLDALGAVVAGIPCNTAHAPPIFDRVMEHLVASGCRLQILNLITETARYVKQTLPSVRRVGILATLGTCRLRLYDRALLAVGLEPVLPDETVQEQIVHRTIYDPGYGIKAQSNPVSKIARQSLLDAIGHLRDKEAEAVILGCTELPLAVPETEVDGVPIIDPTTILARALLQATYPEKVRAL